MYGLEYVRVYNMLFNAHDKYHNFNLAHTNTKYIPIKFVDIRRVFGKYHSFIRIKTIKKMKKKSISNDLQIRRTVLCFEMKLNVKFCVYKAIRNHMKN